MKKALRIIVMLSLSTACLLMCTGFSSAHSVSTNESCVVRLVPLQSGHTTSTIVGGKCFQTFSEAVTYATQGRVHFASTSRPQDLAQSMLNVPLSTIQTSYVLSVEYWNVHYQGASWIYTGSLPCNQVGGYGVSYVGNYWNDQISSAIGYNNCNHVIHWSNANYGGSYIDCNSSCYTMGSMNKVTSSIQWHR